MTGSARAVATGLGLGRLAIGAGLWLAPQQAARTLGFKDFDSRALALGRVAATRDLVLGVWQLRSLNDQAELRRAAAVTAAADAADAVAFADLLRRGERAAGLRGLAAAVPAAVAGAWLAHA
jgi:hypothetical protein